MEKDKDRNRTGAQERKNVERERMLKEEESESILNLIEMEKEENRILVRKVINILLSYNSPVILSDYENKRRRDNH